MSLNWQWDDRMGECFYDEEHQSAEHPFVCNLYRGNAQIIAVNEYPNGTYSLAWFSDDKQHLRNMLGLTKGYENVFKTFGIQKMRLNTRYKEVPTIVSDFAKAKLPITIELYYEEESKQWRTKSLLVSAQSVVSR